MNSEEDKKNFKKKKTVTYEDVKKYFCNFDKEVG